MTTFTSGSGGVASASYTRQFGVLAKYQQNHPSRASALCLTFPNADAYWIMFDGTSAAGANHKTMDGNNTGVAEADFELLDGGAYVRTDLSIAGTLLAAPRPIVGTHHLVVIVEGTELVVRNTDPQHNTCNVYLIGGGPVHLIDRADPTNTMDLVTPGKFITATYSGGKVNYSAEQTTNTADPFYAAIVDSATNLCQ